MSRKDNCLDNTMAESFFGIMKSELLYAENFESTEAFIKALDNYIEYYNNKSQVKWKESGAIPNSFSNRIVNNLSNFLGSLHCGMSPLYAMKDDSSPISELIYVGICRTVDDDFVRVSA